VGTVPGVKHGGEGGLLGIAVASTFSQDRLLYAYFTADDGNRLVRMTVSADFYLGSPQPLLVGIPAGPVHNGGRLAFGPDGMLYVTTGDASSRSHSQDKNSLAGKILRLTPDGKPAPGNPSPGSPVWTFGHRNVQGLAWDAQGRMWASEFGQNTWDELNLIEPGNNYGWPGVEGKAGKQGYADPLVQWRPSEASPSGIAVTRGSVWLASLRGMRLWQVPLDGEGVGTPKAWFKGEFGRLRTVAAAPDGSLWLVTSNTAGRGSPRTGDDEVLRIGLSGG
jgi:glucose/arabinose dehydrogenase